MGSCLFTGRLPHCPMALSFLHGLDSTPLSLIAPIPIPLVLPGSHHFGSLQDVLPRSPTHSLQHSGHGFPNSPPSCLVFCLLTYVIKPFMIPYFPMVSFVLLSSYPSAQPTQESSPTQLFTVHFLSTWSCFLNR